MNVYVRELVSALAQAGVQSNVYVRRWSDDLPDTVDVEPGFRVVHVPAGPADLVKEKLPEIVDEYTDWVGDHLRREGETDAIHANYWLSGLAGHRLKHELSLPLVSTFHTLARVKAETGDPEPARRVEAEIEVIACSDAILASCPAEADQLVSLYGARPERIEIVPPGVDHAFFSPGDQRGARQALPRSASATIPVLLFVGRIQPLKGVDVAVRALHELSSAHPDAMLVIVGGASGVDGPAEQARVRSAGRRARPGRSGALRRPRSRTTCSPPTTAPPTCASCRAAPSRSAWWRSRPPRAARPSWPPTSAG